MTRTINDEAAFGGTYETTEGIAVTEVHVLVKVVRPVSLGCMIAGHDDLRWIPRSCIQGDSGDFGVGYDGPIDVATWFVDRELERPTKKIIKPQPLPAELTPAAAEWLEKLRRGPLTARPCVALIELERRSLAARVGSGHDTFWTCKEST